MALATVDPAGRPAASMVLLKDVRPGGVRLLHQRRERQGPRPRGAARGRACCSSGRRWSGRCASRGPCRASRTRKPTRTSRRGRARRSWARGRRRRAGRWPDRAWLEQRVAEIDARYAEGEPVPRPRTGAAARAARSLRVLAGPPLAAPRPHRLSTRRRRLAHRAPGAVTAHAPAPVPPRRALLPTGTLAAMIVLGIFNHILLAGGRVAVSLDALALGASPAVVGVLMALFALLPMLLSVAAGRLADRVGPRRPMLWGSVGCALAALLPAGFPGLPSLFAASMIAGVSFMLFQVPAQRAIGDLGSAADRAANFSWYALGFSVSGFVAPADRGLRDRPARLPLGLRAARRVPGRRPRRCSPPGASRCRRSTRRMRTSPRAACSTCCAIRCCDGCCCSTRCSRWAGTCTPSSCRSTGRGSGCRRRRSAASSPPSPPPRSSCGWPCPWLGRDLPPPMRVLRIALFIAGAVYVAFPFTSSTLALIVLSFVLGLGLGHRPADGDVAAARPRAGRAHRRDGRAAHVAHPDDGRRRPAGVRHARHHAGPGPRVRGRRALPRTGRTRAPRACGASAVRAT